MQPKQLLRGFRNKLLLECLLKAGLNALMVSAAGVFVTSLVCHIQLRETPPALTTQIGGGLFALVFLAAFLLRYPTWKRVAARVDALGLKERASTMLEYWDWDTPLLQLQRDDAAAHIRSTEPRKLALQVGRGQWIMCALAVCLAAVMLVLPVNAFAMGEEDALQETEPNQAIAELIEQLREEVKTAELEEDMKEELDRIIDQLEEELQDSESELEQATQIQQAMEEMQELMESALTKNQIGEALQKRQSTRSLGEAISDNDAERVTAALEALKQALAEAPENIQALAEDIASALEESGVENTDELFAALEKLKEALENQDPASEELEQELEETFETAREEILEALEQQAAIEEQLGQMEETMEEAKDEVLGIEPEEEEASEGGEEESEGGEEPTEGGEEASEGGEEASEGGEEASEGGENTEDSEGGENTEGSEGGEGMSGSEGGEGEGSTMTEGIYDPISGSVTYGEVFAAYYAQYLEALESGEVPEELQEIMDQYFSALGQ